jgi:hypothetical protein
MRTTLALIAMLACVPALAQEEAAEPPIPRPRPAELASPADDPIRPAWTIREDADAPPEAPVAEAPPRDYRVACPAALQGRVEARMLPPIEDGQCGARSPLEVTGVLANGRMVPLSSGITTDCGMATALPEWIEAIDSYLMARDNTQVAELVVGTSYMCRNVNNASGGNLSFHAFADAIDVTGFRLEDGRTVTVEGDWGEATSPEGRLLRYAHGAACSHFTTVLGPEANALHRDHFHVDLGCHGKTCTARLCE